MASKDPILEAEPAPIESKEGSVANEDDALVDPIKALKGLF